MRIRKTKSLNERSLQEEEEHLYIVGYKDGDSILEQGKSYGIMTRGFIIVEGVVRLFIAPPV